MSASNYTLDPQLLAAAKGAISRAQLQGAKEAAAGISKRRFIELRQRDGKLERIRESSSSSLSVDVYVDGRFSSHSTSDLRPQAVQDFVDQAVAMTRLLGEDPHRHLADPKLYEGRSQADLGLYDGGYEEVNTDQRRAIVSGVEESARQCKGPIISVEAGYSDTVAEWVQVHSNGFEDGDRSTQYWTGATVTVEGKEGRKPEDWHWVGARTASELDDPAKVGKAAAKRALDRLGQVQLGSSPMTVVVENRTAGGFLRHFLSAMVGSSLHLGRSFLKERLGESVGSPLFSMVDNPLLPGGFGSRRFDGDGLSTKPRTLVEAGTLKGYLVDVYYGSKLGMAPTGGSTSNLTIPSPPADSENPAVPVNVLLERAGTGVFITGLLGGNSDSTTGDFSHGFKGFEIINGKLGRPIGEMNVTGSHMALWNKLVGIGDDPYPYSARQIPSLVFDDISVSGA